MQARNLFAALLGSLLACGCGMLHPGMRLLSLEVYQGDQMLLETSFDVPDSYSKSQIWDASGEQPWYMNPDLPPLQPTKKDPLTVRLEGQIKLQIIHGDWLETEAHLEGLTLIRTPTRDSNPQPGWRLPPAEIARAKQAAGF